MLERLEEDYIKSFKNKEMIKVNVLRSIKSNIKLKSIEKKAALTEDEMIDVVVKETKQRKDSISEYQKANRLDLVAKEQAELEILNSYLPKQLSRDEINEIVKNVIDKVAPTGPKDIGTVMKELTPLVKGRADMKEIMAIVKEKVK